VEKDLLLIDDSDCEAFRKTLTDPKTTWYSYIVDQIVNLYNHIKYLLKESIHIWKYGFPQSDTWDLDYTIIKFTYPRFKRFRQLATQGHPRDITDEDWQDILADIEFFLESSVNGRDAISYDSLGFHDLTEQYNRGGDLFHKYFYNLWW
jgi:hypothetical protein